MPHLAPIAAAVVLTGGLAGCGTDDDHAGDGGKVTVFAAASLTEAFAELGERFEDEHEGTEVEFSLAASSELAAQIDAGAPADVFASADEPNMAKVVDAGMAAGEPRIFAGNVLEIAVPVDNPGDVKGLDDLADDDLLVAVCAVEVPCGNAAAGIFENAGVKPAVDSYEPDVKSVLAKVELGEVDAGLVYHSDVLASGDKIDSIRISERDQVVNAYPIVLTKGAENPDEAEDFVDLVLSDAGQAELERWGFRAL